MNNKKIATIIKDFALKNDAASDMRIYFNGICWDFDSDSKMTVIEDILGSEYFEYANDKTVSVSTEGGLYEIINHHYGYALAEELRGLLEKEGVYYELGNSWNFSIYEV